MHRGDLSSHYPTVFTDLPTYSMTHRTSAGHSYVRGTTGAHPTSNLQDPLDFRRRYAAHRHSAKLTAWRNVSEKCSQAMRFLPCAFGNNLLNAFTLILSKATGRFHHAILPFTLSMGGKLRVLAIAFTMSCLVSSPTSLDL